MSQRNAAWNLAVLLGPAVGLPFIFLGPAAHAAPMPFFYISAFLYVVHVRRDRQHCKFWLVPIELAWNHGFSPRELNEIRRLIRENKSRIIEAWHEHCGQH